MPMQMPAMNAERSVNQISFFVIAFVLLPVSRTDDTLNIVAKIHKPYGTAKCRWDYLVKSPSCVEIIPLSFMQNPLHGRIKRRIFARIARLRMRPMSLWESKESSGQVSLQALFEGTQEMGLFENPHTLQDIAYIMCRGGWCSTISASATSFSKYRMVS